MAIPMGLRGPFSLTTGGIDNSVLSVSPGAYALGKMANDQSVFYVHYVGRSDTDVASRLKQHAPEWYPQFHYEYYSTPKAAFEKECNLYHDFKPPDNKVHPARQQGTDWKCPRCPIFG
jgi:hypothetical protein